MPCQVLQYRSPEQSLSSASAQSIAEKGEFTAAPHNIRLDSGVKNEFILESPALAEKGSLQYATVTSFANGHSLCKPSHSFVAPVHLGLVHETIASFLQQDVEEWLDSNNCRSWQESWLVCHILDLFSPVTGVP